MKTVDTLAAIGVVTIVFIGVKTAMSIYGIIYGPFKKRKES